MFICLNRYPLFESLRQVCFYVQKSELKCLVWCFKYCTYFSIYRTKASPTLLLDLTVSEIFFDV